MYNSFNNMWNWDYIQQQQALQHHQNQVYQIRYPFFNFCHTSL